MFAHCLYNNYSYSHLKFEISLMNLKKSGIRWSQPYLQTNKYKLLSPSFPNSHHLRANFPNYKGPDPRYK